MKGIVANGLDVAPDFVNRLIPRDGLPMVGTGSANFEVAADGGRLKCRDRVTIPWDRGCRD